MNPIRKKLRFVFSACVLSLIVVVAAVATKEKDPLLPKLELLSKETDAVFRDPLYEPSTKPDEIKIFNHFNGPRDRMVRLDSPALEKLLKKFEALKVEIENRSFELIDLDLGHKKLVLLSDVATGYLGLQRRLYLNYFRNAHQHLGKEKNFHPEFYDYLNLKLCNVLGLAMSKQKKGFEYNLWHTGKRYQLLDTVMLGLNPQEKEGIEQEVLRERVTEDRYAKLIVSSTLRERLVNHWALQRLSGNVLDDPNLTSCGNNLVVYQKYHRFPDVLGESTYYQRASYDYYQNLKKGDRDAEYEAYEKKLMAITDSKPVITADIFAPLLKEYYSYYPSVNNKNAEIEEVKKTANELGPHDDSDYVSPEKKEEPLAQAASKTTTKAKPAASATPTKVLTLEERAKEIVDNTESGWGDHGGLGLVSANFLGDDWSIEAVASRAATTAFVYRKNRLYKSILADTSEKDRAMGKVKLDEILGPYFKAQEAPYIRKLEAEIVKYLTQSKWEREKAQMTVRFNETFNSLAPAIETGAVAVITIKEIEDAVSSEKKYRKPTKNSSSLTSLSNAHIVHPQNYGRKTEFATIPAHNPILGGIRFYATTPDHLSQLYLKKVQVLSKENHTPKLKKIVKEILKDGIVQSTMADYFKELSSLYLQTLLAKNLSPGAVDETNSPLYELAGKLAEKYYKKLAHLSRPQSTILKKVPPVAAPAKGSPFSTPPNFKEQLMEGMMALPTDHLGKKPQVLSMDAVYAPKQDHSTAELFVQAMALINLGWRIAPSVPTNINPEEGYRCQRPTTPLELESFVLQASRNRTLAAGFVHSVLDQYYMAEIIRDETLVQYPILEITPEGRKSKNLLTLISENPANARTIVWLSIQKAAQNHKGLVEEACRANPFERFNDAFRNVYQTSGSIRASLIKSNGSYEKMDAALKEKTKTVSETIVESSYFKAFMLLTTIAMIVVFAPAVMAGLSSLITYSGAGAWVSFTTAAKASLAAASAAKGLYGLAAAITLGSVGSKVVLAICLAQMSLMANVAFYEMPAQLKYQLRVANSQVGLSGAERMMNRKDMDDYVSVMYGQQISTAVFAAFMTPWFYTTGNQLRKVLATGERKALKNLAKGQPELYNEIRAKTYSEQVKANGFINGTKGYVNEAIISLRSTGKLPVLALNATEKQIQQLFGTNVVNSVESAKTMSAVYESYIAHLGKKIDKLLAFEGKYGHYIDIGTKQDYSWLKKQILWSRGLAARYGFKHPYFKVYFNKNAQSEFINGTRQHVGKTGQYEASNVKSGIETEIHLRRFVAADLQEKLNYYQSKVNYLNLTMKGGEYTDLQALQGLVQGFGSDDVAKHIEVLEYFVKKGKVIKWTSSSQGMADQAAWTRANARQNTNAANKFKELEDFLSSYRKVNKEFSTRREWVYTKLKKYSNLGAVDEVVYDDVSHTIVPIPQIEMMGTRKLGDEGYVDFVFSSSGKAYQDFVVVPSAETLEVTLQGSSSKGFSPRNPKAKNKNPELILMKYDETSNTYEPILEEANCGGKCGL